MARHADDGGRRLLLWDAPNMDMCLSEVIGERASPATRPNMAAVYVWLAQRCHPGEIVEACVFANVPAGHEPLMTPWIVALRQCGFYVFLRPKLGRKDDIDQDMLRHLRKRHDQGGLVEVIVASHDARAFAKPLTALVGDDVEVTVLGFREKDTYANTSEELSFFDVEDVPDAFASALPRTNIYDLPRSGRWLAPLSTPAVPEPTGPSPDRQEVLDAVLDFVASEVDSGVTLREVGDHLRTRFENFDLVAAGFDSVSELIDAAADERGLQIVLAGDEHRLRVAPDEVIDLGEPDEHPPETPVNPIYRAFGVGKSN